MIESFDPDMGNRRERFTPSELITRTKGQCPPPCDNTIYDVKFEKWLHGFEEGEGKSIQIAFADFSFRSESEYLACGWTCIVGELGGNLGFFLGGSLILGIELSLEYIGRLARIVKM